MRGLIPGSRRGAENAAGAAVLIVLIALLIILYVLFLPPQSRCELLDTCDATVPGGDPGTGTPGELRVLYQFVPGSVQEQAPRITQLPSFTVETQTSGNVLAERSGLSISRSVFHSATESVRFSLPPASENVYLSFTAQNMRGVLQIELNGEVVYDSAVSQRQPAPIRLDSSLLSAQNELVFRVSGVGFAFWKTNEYMLSNVRVTADVTSFDDSSQEQRFVVADLDEVERIFLGFVPDCFDSLSAGKLSVVVNSGLVYLGKPECGVPFQTELAKSRVVEGENTVSWSVDAGSYMIDQPEIAVQYEASELNQPLVISQELLSQAAAEGRDILLRLSFAQQGSEGSVSVNGRELAFRTHKSRFDGPITPFVRAGENTVVVTSSTSDVTLIEVLYG